MKKIDVELWSRNIINKKSLDFMSKIEIKKQINLLFKKS